MAVEDKVLRLTAMPPRNEEGLSFFQIDGEAMGTTCRVLFSAASRSVAKAFCSGISTWLASFENRYSRFIDSSMISSASVWLIIGAFWIRFFEPRG